MRETEREREEETERENTEEYGEKLFQCQCVHHKSYLYYAAIEWNGRTGCQPVLTAFLQPRHIPTQGYNITQSSAPDDGHMVAPKHVEQLLEEK